MNVRTLFPSTQFNMLCTPARKMTRIIVLAVCVTAACYGQNASAPAVAISGPYSFKDTPVVPSYIVTVTNTSQSVDSNIVLKHVLGSTDGAYLIAAQPSQGTCELGGQGITSLNCSLGSLDPGASIAVNVVAQMISGAITLSSSATGIDGDGATFSTVPVERTSLHGNPPPATPVVSISLSANPIPKDLVGGRTGTLNWTLQNSTGVRANKLMLAMAIDSRMRITSAVVTGSDSSDPASCYAPTPGDMAINIPTCNIEYLGGSSGGSGGASTVTQVKVTVNYIAPVVSSQTTLLATGYLSFDGSDGSNPISIGHVRVK